MSNNQDLVLFAGETRVLTLYARDASNNPQDLTNMDISWRAGKVLYEPDQTQPVLAKTGTVLDATAGTFTITLEPSDTMPLAGLYVHDAFTSVDGLIQFVSDADEDIDFVSDAGDVIFFYADNDGFLQIVTQGVLNIRRSVRQ